MSVEMNGPFARWVVHLTEDEALVAEDIKGGTGTAFACQLALKTKEDALFSKSCSGAVSAMTIGGGVICLAFLDALELFPGSLLLLFRVGTFFAQTLLLCSLILFLHSSLSEGTLTNPCSVRH